jgi:hypothetical protein
VIVARSPCSRPARFARFGRNQSSGRKKEDEMSNREYDSSVWGEDREARGRDDRGHGGERGWFDRAGDEVSSWFGDEDAERRRRADERNEIWREKYAYDNGSDYRHNYGRYGYDSDRVRRDLDRGSYDRHEGYDRRESYGRGLYGGGDARRGGDSDWHNQRPLTDRDRSREGEYDRRRGDRTMGWGNERYRGDMRGRGDVRGSSDAVRNGGRDRSMESFREGGRSWDDDSARGSYRDRNWNGNTAYRGYGGDHEGDPRSHERHGGDYERYDRSSYAGLSNEDSRGYDFREYNTGRHDRSWRG